MSSRNCCIKDCTNSGYHIKKWQKQFCDEHHSNFGIGCCTCDPPFKLYPFPNEKSETRLIWIKSVNRKDWKPNSDSRICSKHFPDGDKSKYPTLHLGYESTPIKYRALPKKRHLDLAVPVKKRKTDANLNLPIPDNNTNERRPEKEHIITTDHSYLKSSNCADYNKDTKILYLQQQVQHLRSKLIKSKLAENKAKLLKPINNVNTNKKVKFYTGIPTVKSFNIIFDIVERNSKHIHYWRGPKHLSNPLKSKILANFGKKRQLSRKEEFLMTLMKLRLGLLNEDLGHRFSVSSSHVSRTITTWFAILSQVLGSLVFNPDKYVVKSNLPPSFKNPTYSDVRHIIDCSEVFLETAHSLEVQSQTWSDYKHHHTSKFLISINPSGMINFVSRCWGGRASDKYITSHSGFLDIIEPYDKIMADKGFPIVAELALLQAQLIIPPGRRGATQMSLLDVKKTKEIANRRIYVEQAICRMKNFRILKYELPLTMAQHLDNIIKIVAGICNLYPPLPNYKRS